jgi:adenylate kinase
MNIIFLGPQGSGKGTQAKLLSEKMGLAYLEMGQILREISREETALGKKVNDFLKKGLLVDDQILLEILKNYLTPKNFEKGILFDGFPRNLNQAKLLEETLQKYQAEIDKVIFLNISFSESIRRLTARRICPQCGRVYNLVTLPPKNDNLCDDCGVQLVKRDDESEEVIKKRLEIYQKETKPVIAYFRQKKVLIEVDGERPIEVIHKEILRKLNLS